VLVDQQLADPAREFLVVGHRRKLAAEPERSAAARLCWMLPRCHGR
jgi:hypothetical protein